MSTRKTLYRDPCRARIAGVCAGVAEYFGIELWLVRILVVAAFLLFAGSFILLAYIAGWFILEKKPGALSGKSSRGAFYEHEQPKRKGKGWHNINTDDDERVVVKSKVWQAGEPPKQAFSDIQQQFENNEKRLRNVETYVTSSEFQLNREISRL